ncbi:MAG: glycosyltransferase [Tepidiformaceae bacterium]
MSVPAASVIIPTYNRPALLLRCLAALAAQDIPHDAFEVIVVHDGPSTDTPAAVAQFARAHPGFQLTCHALARNAGPATARNHAIRAARAPIVACTDDDCLPQPGWLRAGLAALESGATGATGRIIVPRGDPPTELEALTAGLETSPFVTANAFYRRDALLAVGGMHEAYDAPWREDSDLLFTLLDAGHTLVEAPGAVVIHPVRTVPWGASVRAQRRFVNEALLLKRHPVRYRQSGERPPYGHYAASAAIALALLGILLRSRTIALLAAATWTALTLALAASRLRHTRRDPANALEILATSTLIPPLSVYHRQRGAIRHRHPFL